MSLLFRIIYAAHANGTHHKLALDGLAELAIQGRSDWQRLFLKHAEQFMDGAKAPDTKFKDFKNHVLHVRDGYWGGAPDLASTWYQRTIDELKLGKWIDAVYSAGVMSHYVTDPLMPFHTGQTDAENAIHAAAEWSINRSYNDLRAIGLNGPVAPVERPAGPNWLREMMIAGAERSNAHYERLIAHYDIKRGVVDPPSGLDEVARRLVAGLLVDAAARYGVILGSAITEAGVPPPPVDLTIDTVLAAVKIPIKTLKKRLADAADRAVVEAQYDELIATGKVEKTLREDDRTVRDVHAVEVLAPRRTAEAAARQRVLLVGAQPAIVNTVPHVTAPEPASVTDREISLPETKDAEIKSTTIQSSGNQNHAIVKPGIVSPVAATKSTSKQRELPTPPAAVPAAATKATAGLSTSSAPATPRAYLAVTDPVEAAPVIGPKTAARLEAVGIVTIADLLAAAPAQLASRLADKRFSAAEIKSWQHLSRLVMDLPGLRGTHAQLLAGAGYVSAQAVAESEENDLVQRVIDFAMSPAGGRILRDGASPDRAQILAWLATARRSSGRLERPAA